MRCLHKAGMVLAVMLLALTAMAETFPPVIGNIPDVIIIGDIEDEGEIISGQTVGGWFRFPNAINLDYYVCDMDTPTSFILWSFYEDPDGPDGEIDNYEINGITQLDDPADALFPGAKELTNAVDTANRNPWLSIWDIKACPQKDSEYSYNPAAQELSDGNIIIYASDGFGVASKSITITSLRGAFDQVSAPPPFGVMFPFDDPDSEGWEPFPTPSGTVINDELGDFIISPVLTDTGVIGIDDNSTSNVFGSWQTKYNVTLEYEKDYLYLARYELKTDQPNKQFVPQVRMRWSDFKTLTSANLIIDKGNNSLTTDWSVYNSYYYQPTTEDKMCRNLRLYFDVVDFTPEQSGAVWCNSIEVMRFAPPTMEPFSEFIYDSVEDFMDNWAPYSVPAFDAATSGVSTTGVWLEAEPGISKTPLTFGAWGLQIDKATQRFEADRLYKITFTLRCESESARSSLPMIRMRVSNGAFDTMAFRSVRQVDENCAQMPTADGRDYPLFFESPQDVYPGSKDFFPLNSIVLDFDIVATSSPAVRIAQFGRVYLDKVVIQSFPKP
ncbi:MAG TPA: hypothetical protein PKW18_04040 [Candidatus Sumerlaeota bacterium]|nr:MAG: hypothetical protein BWY12_01325 [candidate division BRC1 bacterium ADurb.Bin183]HOE64104.1 hypothetical protein [Candidatus Sumerlaeota bacterium]HRR31102.1 hypothetical protein [Candidatus Sumerlaeia bacterium]HON51325.1 hypothetical protein [Candidatus Sumerlaeota bacterium]HOR65703.1 hypothetical protein [Candidatus Sumerlaeota bacterium]